MLQKPKFRLTTVAALVAISLYSTAHAGIVREDVDYQHFRDFAENKGLFKVGATNIPISDKQNNFLGLVMKDVPMIDFSSVDRKFGIATLFEPQYITSVSHNGGYSRVEFGGQGNHPDAKHFEYRLVDRNNHPHEDYHTPRLHKLVTEVIPANSTKLGTRGLVYTGDQKRFPVFVRMGSGMQYVQNKETRQNRYVDYASEDYLTGGTALKVTPREYVNGSITHDPSNLFDTHYSPLTSMGQPGDSGSPLFAYDAQEKKWLLVGVLVGHSNALGNLNTIPRQDFIDEKLQEDIAGCVTNSVAGQQFTWSLEGNNSSQIRNTNNSFSLTVPVKDRSVNDELKALNHGKTLQITGNDGILLLNENIDQGAGALHFGANFTVKGKTERTTWQGAGIIVDEGKTVDWQIWNPQGDRLSKLGKGTLYVNATDRNQGSISVGDGEVVIAQRGRGNKQAFSEIHIVSGRPTVKLTDGYIRPDNIYFGFRGGRLDLNGNSLVFERIKSVDDGARIVNHHPSASSNVSLTGVLNNKLTGFGGHLGEDNTDLHNGELNVQFASQADSTFLFNGYAHLNGNFTVSSGRVVLSGKQPIRALDQHNSYAEIIQENNWENRSFSAKNFIVNGNSALHVTRNVDTFNANVTATNNASVQLGYLPNSPICIRSDYKVSVTCNEQKTLAPEIESTLPITQIRGNIVLEDKASLKIGKATLTGTIQNGYHTPLTLTNKAKWVLTDSSKIWHLNLDKGAEITLNEKFDEVTHGQSSIIEKFNTLKINGNLTGSGKFNFLTDIASQKGDKVIVNGFATGDFILAMKNSGNEPQSAEQLSLLKLNHGAQEEFTVNVSLENQEVDLGTYRYQLRNDKYDYRLHNPQKEQELKREKERLEAEEKAQKQALQQQLADAQTLLANAQQEVTNIRQQLETLRNDNSQANLITELQNQLAKKAAQLQQVQQRIEQVEAEKHEVERNALTTRQQLEQQNRQLSTTLSEIQDKVNELESSLSQLQQNLNEKALQLTNAQSELAVAKADEKDLRRQLDALRNDSSQTTLINELERQLNQKNQTIAQIQQKIRQAETNKQQADREISQTRTALEQAQQQNSVLTERLSQTESALALADQAKRHLEAMVARLEQLKQDEIRQKARAEQALTEANLQLAEKTSAVAQAQQELIAAQQAQQQAERSLAEARLAKQEADNQLANHQQNLSAEKVARQEAESAKAQALAAQTAAENAKVASDMARKNAEQAKQIADFARAEADKAMQQAIALATEKALAVNQLSVELAEALQAKADLESRLQNQAQSEAELAKMREKLTTTIGAVNRLQNAVNAANAEANKAKQEAEKSTQSAIQTIAEKTLALQQSQTLLDKALKEQQRSKLLAEEAIQAESKANKALAKVTSRLQNETRLREKAENALLAAEQAREAVESAKASLQQALEEERLAHQKTKLQANQAESASKQLEKETKEAVKALEQAKQKLQEAEIALAKEQKKAEEALANQPQTSPKLPLQRELISRYANTALSEWSAQRNQLTQVTESLNRYLLDSSEDKGNVWANFNGLNASYVSDNHRQYDQKAVLAQLGVNATLDDKQQMKVGLVLSKNDSNSSFADHHSAKSSLKMFSVLAKKSWDNGVFVSFNGGYGRSDTTLNTNNQKQTLKRQLWHTGVNLGYQWKTDMLTAQPMIGVGYQHISGVNYRLNNAEIVIDDLNFATYRAGLALHKTFTFGDWTVTPRFTSYYVDASQKKAILKSNGIALNQQAGRYLQNELGLSAQFKQWELNLHGGVLSGNQIGKQKFAGLKFSYKW